MNIREMTEEREYELLSPYAAKSRETLGRQIKEPLCEIRTEYRRDVDRITHSKAFRRLMHKTQVFISPSDDHYRTRLTHTLEVSQIARTIARGLFLNEALTEAIAYAHDLGHTPFGHIGEEVLNEICENGFCHNEQSLRVVDYFEKENGLNLTYEVRDGIVNHTGKNIPKTSEGNIVRLADRIAYINHDIDDAIRAGILSKDSIPKKFIKSLGSKHSIRINTMILDVLSNSENGEIKMSKSISELTDELRDFMFENVYLSQAVRKKEDKCKGIVKFLYEYFYKNVNLLPVEYLKRLDSDGKAVTVCDYIAGMTDRYAITTYEEKFLKSEIL